MNTANSRAAGDGHPSFILAPFSDVRDEDAGVAGGIAQSDPVDAHLFESLGIAWNEPDTFIALITGRHDMVLNRFLGVMDWQLLEALPGPAQTVIRGSYLRLTGVLWASLLGRPALRIVDASFDDELAAVQSLLADPVHGFMRAAFIVNIYRRNARALCGIAHSVQQSGRSPGRTSVDLRP